MRKTKFLVPGEEVDHALVGRNVKYRDRVWKVAGAQRRANSKKPWLILRDGFDEASAKPRDIVLVFD